MVEQSAFFWMEWLTPLELMTCTLVSKHLYVTAHSDALWVRHRDALLRKCPSLSPLFSRNRKQKRGRFDSIQLDTSTRSKPWARPSGIWNVFMKLSSQMWDALFQGTKKTATMYTAAYLEFVLGAHTYTAIEAFQELGKHAPGRLRNNYNDHILNWTIHADKSGAIRVLVYPAIFGHVDNLLILSSISIWDTFLRTGHTFHHHHEQTIDKL